MRLGLVLGAGGAAAWVFHTGVVGAVRDELGIDPSGASVIVGTSAGAAVAAALRSGVAVEEIYEAVTTPPSPDRQAAMRAELRSSTKTLRPLSPRLVRHALPGGMGPTVALAGILPPGWFPTGWLAGFPGMDRSGPWPEGLWIPAVRATDGEVVVFGKDRCDVPVPDAVEASSAVPGMFRPKSIHGVPHVDGGVASSTHAGLLAGAGVDLAIVSAPMARPGRRVFARHARRMLATELEALRRTGIETIVAAGSSELAAAARGFPRRNPGAAALIATLGRTAAREAMVRAGREAAEPAAG